MERGITVGEVVKEFDLMTGSLRKGDFTEDRVLQALTALADEESLLVLASGREGRQGGLESNRLMTEQSVVLLVPPHNDIKKAFVARDAPSSSSSAGAGHSQVGGEPTGVNRSFLDAFGTRRVGRETPRLVITDRVRRLVLEPLEVASVD